MNKLIHLKTLLALLVLTLSSLSHAVEPGEKAPGFSLPTLANFSGKTLKLDSFRGHVVYVDFWASWCGPCRKSFPALNKIRNSLKEEGKSFEVIAINTDEKRSDAEAFLKKIKVDYPVVADHKGSTPEAYKIKGMPYAFIIDKNGVVQHIHKGYTKSDPNKIRKKIEALL